MEKLVCELGSTQVDGQSSIESLEVKNGRVAPEYAGREGNMVHSASCEGTTARHADVDIDLDRVPEEQMSWFTDL